MGTDESGGTSRHSSSPATVPWRACSWTVGWSPDGRALFVGIGGGNRSVGPAGSGTVLQMSATRTGTMLLDTGDRDLRDGLQYPAYTTSAPLRHGGYPGASDDVLPLAAGTWPYTDYHWVNW